MKIKHVTCVVLLLACVAAATELRADERRVKFGLRGGLNLATLRGDDASFSGEFDGPSADSLTGFSGGAFVSIPVTDGLQVQPELLFTQKGASYDVLGETVNLEFDYIEIPVLLKARFGSDAVAPGIFVGPSVGFKIRGEGKSFGEAYDLESVKGTDFGIVFGAGLDLAAGPGAVVIDARYTLGLTTIHDSGSDIKHGVWSFSVGYSF